MSRARYLKSNQISTLNEIPLNLKRVDFILFVFLSQILYIFSQLLNVINNANFPCNVKCTGVLFENIYVQTIGKPISNPKFYQCSDKFNLNIGIYNP